MLIIGRSGAGMDAVLEDAILGQSGTGVCVCVCLHVCACVRACVVCVCAYVCAFVCVCCTCFVSSSFLPRGGGHGAARTSLAPCA